MSLAYEAEIEEPEGEESEAPAFDLMAAMQSPNIAFDLDEQTLAAMGRKVVEEYEIDEASLKDNGYRERCDNALKLAMLAKETKTYPFENASNVKFPLLITAAIQFNARAYPAIVDGFDVVKAKVLGRPTDEKRDRADRIGRHMSWQLLEEMEDWEEDTDQLLLALPIVGTMFRKTYFDPVKGRNCSHLRMPDKFVVNYWAKRDLSVCPRGTDICEFYPDEIETKFRSGLWLRQELGRSEGEDDDAPHTFLEQYRRWDLDEDGYAEPYIVTVHKETARVVRVYANFDENDIVMGAEGVVRIEPNEYFTKYGFIPAPDGSFYDLGFGTLLEPQNETINSLINQLMDAGHLANVQGGFIGNGVSIKSGNLRFKPGEWKKVDVTGQSLKDNIVPLPAKEPSAVLFNLLGMLVESAKEVTATKDILTGDQPANTPVGTTLALIEQGLKVFTAIYKRIHRSLKRELRILYELNARYLEPEVYYNFQDEEGAVAQADYAVGDIDVLPVSDPTIVTDMQRMARAQFLQTMRTDPLMNGQEINRRVLEAAAIPDVEALFAPAPQGPPPEMLAQMAELEQKNRELEIKAAEATARNAKVFTDMVTALANLGKQQVKGPNGETETVETGVNPAVFDIATQIYQAAEAELNGQVQPGQLPGMEAPPPDAGVPALPDGPAEAPGEPMAMGPGVDPGASDQGPPVGGTGEPQF